MKNKRPTSVKSIFEKRGFYIALYSCIGLVLVSAVAITYFSLDDGGGQTAQVTGDTVEKPAQSASSAAQSYLTPEDKTAASEGVSVEIASVDDVLPVSGQGDKPVTPQPEIPVAAAQADEGAEVSSAKLQPVLEEAQPVSGGASSLQEPAQSVESDREDDSAYVSSSSDDNASEMLADPVFNTYTGNEEMLWPVSGEIVMKYSTEALVYDKTLNQFRTNDTICIAANVGDQVKASSDGVVKSITNSREYGNTIVIEHGNGWFTTYSQLQDGILVDEGDVVTQGQVIGGIGMPSIYSVLLGNHLSFKVTKDDATIDPAIVLASN